MADRVIREELIDLVFLGRPALSNPHWPVWAARELAHNDPFSLVPEDWAWWLRNFRAHDSCIGLAASQRLGRAGYKGGLRTPGLPPPPRSTRAG